ncbi:MAG: hypothetical protein J1D85_03030 [Bacteroidales bacterium]|nr:hypothetical protein [Bacteroidales bacterium]
MKTVEEIERLSAEELEKLAAGQQGVRAPQGLQQRLMEAIAADALAAEGARRRTPRLRRLLYVPALAAVAAVVLLIAAQMQRQSLKDSFDDPYLAYAEVERTLRSISDKMSIGADIAKAAGESAGKTREIIDKTLSSK